MHANMANAMPANFMYPLLLLRVVVANLMVKLKVRSCIMHPTTHKGPVSGIIAAQGRSDCQLICGGKLKSTPYRLAGGHREPLTSADGKTIEIWELRHTTDPTVLSAWAKHFRHQYCSDSDIDSLRAARSRKDYLEQIKFPSRSSNLGPSVRAGDFGEILVADYLQWILGYWVPSRSRASTASLSNSPSGTFRSSASL
jgi:hypothetical protein